MVGPFTYIQNVLPIVNTVILYPVIPFINVTEIRTLRSSSLNTHILGALLLWMFSLRLAGKVNSSIFILHWPRLIFFPLPVVPGTTGQNAEYYQTSIVLIRCNSRSSLSLLSRVIAIFFKHYFIREFMVITLRGGGMGVSSCKTNDKQFLIWNHSDLEFWFLCSHWI